MDSDSKAGEFLISTRTVTVIHECQLESIKR